MSAKKHTASRAKHIADVIVSRRRRKLEERSDYPFLVWVRRYPEYYARLGWRESDKGGFVERIK